VTLEPDSGGPLPFWITHDPTTLSIKMDIGTTDMERLAYTEMKFKLRATVTNYTVPHSEFITFTVKLFKIIAEPMPDLIYTLTTPKVQFQFFPWKVFPTDPSWTFTYKVEELNGTIGSYPWFSIDIPNKKVNVGIENDTTKQGYYYLNLRGTLNDQQVSSKVVVFEVALLYLNPVQNKELVYLVNAPQLNVPVTDYKQLPTGVKVGNPSYSVTYKIEYNGGTFPNLAISTANRIYLNGPWATA
jgi:hypothetical protein